MKILNLVKIKLLYIYIVIFFIAKYFYEAGKKDQQGIYSFIENYFGITVFFIFFILVLNAFSLGIKDRKKRIVYEIKLHFFVFMIFGVAVLYFMHLLKLPFSETKPNIFVIKQFVDIALYKYKLGILLTFLIQFLFLKINLYSLYIICYTGTIFSFLFLVIRPVRITITQMIKGYKLRKRIALEKKMIQEQIELQELFERKEKQSLDREKR